MNGFSKNSLVGSSKEVCEPQRIRVAFYTCGDGGIRLRRFGPLDPTEAYRQLAGCLATDGYVFPRHSRQQAINDRTFNSIDACGCIMQIPSNLTIEKLYFIGHGTGVPSGYFFSGDPHRTNREEFSVQSNLQLLFLDEIELGVIENGYLYTEGLNARSLSDEIQSAISNFGVMLSSPSVHSLRTNRYWVIHDQDYRYELRRNLDNELTLTGHYTHYHEAHQRFIDEVKRRLAPNAKIYFLCCFTASANRGGLIRSMYERISQSHIIPAVHGVEVAGYRDYFVIGIPSGSIRNGRLTRIVLRVERYGTDTIISQSQGFCGPNLALPSFQERYPLVSTNSTI